MIIKIQFGIKIKTVNIILFFQFIFITIRNIILKTIQIFFKLVTDNLILFFNK